MSELVSISTKPAHKDVYGHERTRYYVWDEDGVIGEYEVARIDLTDEHAIALRDALLERYPVEQPDPFAPDWSKAPELCIVSRAALDATNARIAALEAEVARLKVLEEACERVQDELQDGDVGQMWANSDGSIVVETMGSPQAEDATKTMTLAAAIITLAAQVGVE